MAAAGVPVELVQLSANGDHVTIALATTNRDGRTDEPLITGRPLPIAHYELRFHVAGYFARLGTPQSDPPFLDTVPVRFAIFDAKQSYHVPLYFSPWGILSYRGS